MTSNGNGHQKETLNASSNDGSDSDEELNARQMLDKYADMNDSMSADPDYVPQETDGDSTDSDFPTDSDEEKTESQRKLNGIKFMIVNFYRIALLIIILADDRDDSKITSGNVDKSNVINSQWLCDEKTLEKVTKFLEEAQAVDLKNFNDEIFYSPIGERKYSAACFNFYALYL